MPLYVCLGLTLPFAYSDFLKGPGAGKIVELERLFSDRLRTRRLSPSSAKTRGAIAVEFEVSIQVLS